MDPEQYLPLKAEVFRILMRLLEGPSHGYQIMTDIREATDGSVNLLPGALYRHLAKLLEQEVIEEVEGSELGSEADQRRRYYAVTPLGRQVARAEAQRLAQLLDLAAAHRLVDP